MRSQVVATGQGKSLPGCSDKAEATLSLLLPLMSADPQLEESGSKNQSKKSLCEQCETHRIVEP